MTIEYDWPSEEADPDLTALPIDDERGTSGMWLAIVTEALLFVSLFFAYFYLGHLQSKWPPNAPPRQKALILLAILVSSSVLVHVAEHYAKKGARLVARLWLGATIVFGGAFVALQVQEYRNHVEELWPTDNAYSSLFYTITSLHALHVAVGLAMLLYVLVLPIGPTERPPHKPLHNAALYWHFVDVVWICVVFFLYLLPHWWR